MRRLTTEERQQCAQALAEALHVLAEAEESAKATQKEIKKDLDERRAWVRKLADAVRTGTVPAEQLSLLEVVERGAKGGEQQ